jgi:CheY-like chemotaxis protein
MVEHPVANALTTAGKLEPATSAKESYKVLISEAYIKPIRSAIIVDDDYITLESLIKLNKNKNSNIHQTSPHTYEKLLEVIEACKASPRHWLVDVNDASNIANNQYENLHQSDLMILDYHLEKNDDGGTRAIEVLRSLANNPYFNLVIVYTNCKADNELDSRVLEIANGLIFRDSPLGQLDIAAPDSLTKWEDDESEIATTLDKNLDVTTFLKFFQESDIEKWKDHVGFNKISELISNRRKNKQVHVGSETIKWLIANKRSKNLSKFSETDYGKVDFCIGKINWVRTNNLFVTVVSKDISAAQLPEKLLDALELSNPSPHQLIMTKIRNVMDEKGVSAEKNVLRKDHLQAYWLMEMLEVADDKERSWKLKQTIRHHWDELASEINQDVKDYGERLFESIKNVDGFSWESFVKSHTSLDMTEMDVLQRVKEEWNSFVCSQSVDDLHIMTGHIFRLSKTVNGQSQKDGDYWICLSPACDLVPGQKSKWGGKNIRKSKLLPFKAVRLFRHDNIEAMNAATRSEFIFLKSGKDIHCYSYLIKGNTEGNPVWDQFFAHNNGYIPENKTFTASAISFGNSEEILMERVEYQAEIVAQLRYEYALNLLQRLGGSLSRIGLDFVKHEKQEVQKSNTAS